MIEAMTKLAKEYSPDQITFFCIGTDRSTGDAFGLLVGSRLTELGYNVVGTLDDPTHAENLMLRLLEVPEGHVVVAVDSCLGHPSNVGCVRFKSGPLRPGAGVGKNLPSVGDYSLIGIVNVGGFMEYLVLQNTRLSLVMQMVQQAVEIISAAIPLPSNAAEVAATTEDLNMKATGIVRKMDELGRVVLPKELRRTLGISEGDPLEVFVQGELILLRKYVPGCIITGALDDLIEFQGKQFSRTAIGELARKAGV
ncbi:spore protease YyaC [Cohnella boryungensis]|uniref:Spore protease YyaC n=1 Tax=Cohnella boryungensis TaxID=768479 RepID=A0ABV8SEX2_9BACL